jgi:hypothetical protein
MNDLKNHWSGYLNALGKSRILTSTNCIPLENTNTKIGVSGFLDLKPVNTTIDPRYDIMLGSREGISSSEMNTLKQKSDKTEFMPYSSR